MANISGVSFGGGGLLEMGVAGIAVDSFFESSEIGPDSELARLRYLAKTSGVIFCGMKPAGFGGIDVFRDVFSVSSRPTLRYLVHMSGGIFGGGGLTGFGAVEESTAASSFPTLSRSAEEILGKYSMTCTFASETGGGGGMVGLIEFGAGGGGLLAKGAGSDGLKAIGAGSEGLVAGGVGAVGLVVGGVGAVGLVVGGVGAVGLVVGGVGAVGLVVGGVGAVGLVVGGVGAVGLAVGAAGAVGLTALRAGSISFGGGGLGFGGDTTGE